MKLAKLKHVQNHLNHVTSSGATVALKERSVCLQLYVTFDAVTVR